MTNIRFSDGDGQILYFIPKEGGDITNILLLLIYVERTNAPTYERFSECMTNAIKAGIVEVVDGNFRVTPQWYGLIHDADNISDEPLYEFEQKLLSTDFRIENNCQFTLDRSEYESAVESTDVSRLR